MPSAHRSAPPSRSAAPSFARELEVAIAAARAAAAIQVDLYENLERVVHKGDKDVVTEADHLSEEVIIATIRAAFPTDAFLAEESGHSGPGHEVEGKAGPSGDGGGRPRPRTRKTEVRQESGAPGGTVPHRLWVIDPLDGTVNYANGIPFFCTSVGLAVGGRPVVGVVLDPLRDELFSAVAGEGARLDGRAIVLPDKRLADAVASLSLPSRGHAGREGRIRKAIRVSRDMGSAALALAYVANGRFEAFIQSPGLSAWDICAAGLIAAEGGALVTDIGGHPWFDLASPTRSMSLLAAAPAHHATLLGLLRWGLAGDRG